jgi:hypothetical protein
MSSRANRKRRQRGELPPATKRERAYAAALRLLALGCPTASSAERMRAKAARFAQIYGASAATIRRILEGANEAPSAR